MGRVLRFQYADGIFHVWNRRVDRWPLFVDIEDYEQYMALFRKTTDRFRWEAVAFCLMPNHIHLLVKLSAPNMDKGMQFLHGSYVRWFNDRHERTGRLFEGPYRSKAVEDEVYLATVVQYIHENPVRARLCRRREEWPWSSAFRNGTWSLS